MDAMDVNWCLTCSRHIDVEGNAPYCSRECYTSDQPASSSALASPVYNAFDSAPIAESISELDDCDLCSRFESSITTTERSRWIGKGDAGIYAWARDVPPGPPSGPDSAISTADLRPPKLLQTTRRPVPPSLCMSKTIPAPAPSGSSRPVLSSLPSLSSQCPTNTSVASLTTPSSSVSPASPIEASPSPCPPTTTTVAVKGGFISALTAQVRSWTASSKECPRSETVTRQSRTASAVQAKASLGYEFDGYWGLSTEKLPLTDDHPAFRARGRRSSRVVS
ncbi:uncharacterized protein B0H18DRAFT_1115358 [Fomitopsis serialis]|uniref:uncharacterized protein n=1 Tax=Fomitopsis serialis TaxID=139415 RepID=UPI002007F712|nr:uncharacterized protein B0H18DRAFT_1115358 [Neoantrodia serialis]KAH9933350.1 hypothetical protein B0H18DRAFT_1115358 [Neoantrodia serialis]